MDDFSRFAVLALPISETVIPEDLVINLEIASNRGPLGANERRPIGLVAAGCEAPILAALRARLRPLGLDVTPQVASYHPKWIDVFVHRLAT